MAEKVKHVTLTWAGGTHRFEMPLMVNRPTLAGSQAAAADDGVPLGPLAARVMGEGWSVGDLAHVIRCCLLGGGSLGRTEELGIGQALAAAFCSDPSTPAAKADGLIEAYVFAAPIGDALMLARVLLMVTLVGIDAELADAAASVDKINAAMAS
jgi:hypothetical protein